jgi:predicted porin
MFNLGEIYMKKSLVALAALAATGAFAQSSITLSGIADVGLQYNSSVTNGAGAGLTPGAAKLTLGAGNNNRLVFSGSEDLGGGMAGIFAFQMRLDPTRGNQERGTNDIGYAATGGTAATANISTSRPLFQGESTVGLSGGFGRIKLGRLLPANQQLNGGTIDPWGVTTVAGTLYQPGFSSDYTQGGEGRVGNQAMYSTPNIAGFQAHISHAFDRGPTDKTYNGASVSYANGPIAAMLGYEANRFGDKLVNLGGNYDLGFAKLYAGYGQAKGGTAADRAGATFLATASSASGGGQVVADGKVNNFSIGANIPFGAATARLGYSGYTGAGGAVGNSKESKLGLGLNYALSKRTAIYTDLASSTRKSAALSKVNQFDMGIAHSF